MPTHQLSLPFIAHHVQNSVVEQRTSDGYINATAMCKAAGKLMADYTRLKSTQEFLDALEPDVGIPISQLIQSLRGSNVAQGTWVHPQVAIHLAQWLSPQFAVMVSKWVFDWMSGKEQPAKLPYHLRRHMLNYHKVPNGWFSVLQEMTNRLVAPMEAQGYQLPENMMPDIAHGRMFCKYLKDKKNFNTDELPTYEHEFPDGRVVSAKLYPVEYLGDFSTMLAVDWFPNHAPKYFKDRDPGALIALNKIMLIGYVKPSAKSAANKRVFYKKLHKAA
ncbi:MAG: KilA-N domain-containing protein [Burkholderiaceae bacterium]|jgi:hypothetical protein|nr:KilA-N domain-containing protein [Burkholderiaceae bacterium]